MLSVPPDRLRSFSLYPTAPCSAVDRSLRGTEWSSTTLTGQCPSLSRSKTPEEGGADGGVEIDAGSKCRSHGWIPHKDPQPAPLSVQVGLGLLGPVLGRR